VHTQASPDQVRECRARLFNLYREGKLLAWIDRSHTFVGVDAIPDAMDYMLSGASLGKVVARIAV
jgi:NADPH-dependent curcumin reductase CurA